VGLAWYAARHRAMRSVAGAVPGRWWRRGA